MSEEEVVEKEPQQASFAVTKVPWLHQLYYVLRKNAMLMSRRPVQLVIMCFSSVASVLLAFWLHEGSNYYVDFDTLPLTKCGTVDREYWRGLDWDELEKLPLSHNMAWSDGLGLELMGK